jgi:hypothetical protein
MPTRPRATQLLGEFFDDSPRTEPGAIYPLEAWWVECQQALEQAGYMLRPRYRPGWKPSWAGTKKNYRQFEDGQVLRVRLDTPALEFLCS